MTLLVLLACSNPDLDREVRVWTMQDHQRNAAAARDAVVHGDLAAANRAGAALGQPATLPGFDAEEQLVYDRLKVRAAFLEGAETNTAASERLAELAPVCVECHRLREVRPLPVEPPPVVGAGEMERHAWAAEALWESMVFDHPERAQLALTVLGEPAEGLDPEKEQGLHALAEAVAEREDPRDRAKAYGRLLDQCRACHQRDPRSVPATIAP